MADPNKIRRDFQLNRSQTRSCWKALAQVVGVLCTTSGTVNAQVTPFMPPAPERTPSNDSGPAETPHVARVTPGEWASGIKLGLQLDSGIVGNPQDPSDHRNFGQLITDNANRPVLNQVLLTVGRDVDAKATRVDVGFKVQALYGSDARIYQTMGVFDQLIHDRNQIALLEANVSARFPQIFSKGLDVKAGLYPTPLGIELLDPKTNPFYSHSYIFNYGLPFKHTGVLTISHMLELLDIYFGVDTGTNTWLAYGAGDNNRRPGGLAGFGLHNAGGKLTVLALTHIGPEDSLRNATFGNSALRYFNDMTVVWKVTAKLTISGEANYAREEGFNAEAWGLAGYAAVQVTEAMTFNGRAELFRDSNNFFVSNPVGSRDFINLQRGTSANIAAASRPTTYSEFTAGVTYKPSGLSGRLKTFMVRPEIRYDRALNDTRPFGAGADRGAVTLSGDIVLGF